MKKDFKILSNNFKGQLNLDLTINSGQTSQPAWLKKNRYFNELIIVDGKPCLIKIKSNELDESLEIVVESPKEFRINAVKNHISEIFGLNDNLDDLYEFLLNDPKLEPTIDFCRGLRLFKAHNTFECLISSISSANNSIIRWNRSIRLMKEKWGDGYQFLSGNFYIFPTPEKILQVPEHEVEELEICGGEKNLEECVNNLKSCGVGYRSKYIKSASNMVTEEINLNEMVKIGYEEAFQTLLEIPGVGPKVADCILLYGFGMGEAFPVDIWIKRIICELYFNGKDVSVPKIRLFGIEQFGEYAGYVQLYLFHYARKSGLLEKIHPKKNL
ncbi:MAG: DNA glycosylase [Methanobacterium sp.]